MQEMNPHQEVVTPTQSAFHELVLKVVPNRPLALVSTILFVSNADLATAGPAPEPKGVSMEVWRGIRGRVVTSLTSSAAFNKAPTEIRIIPSLEIKERLGDFYGVRSRRWLLPPKTGKYQFWMAADDHGELWLSTDASSEKKRMLCRNPEYTAPQEWDKNPKQASGPVSLEGGKRYYVEILMKQDAGGECLAIAWDGPGIKRNVVGSAFLLQYRDQTQSK